MIQFRQKEYVAPLVAGAAAGGGLLSTLGTGAMIASVPLSVGGMVQASNQSNQAEEQARIQEEQIKKQNRLLKRIAENAQNNPGTAGAVAETLGQRNMSLVVKRFAAVSPLLTWKNVQGLGRDIWNFTKAHKQAVISAPILGGTVGAAGYLANKGVELDMKRSGIPMPGKDEETQKQYAISPGIMKTGASILNGVKEWGGAGWNYIKSNPKMMTGMAVMGSAPTVLGYVAEKGQLKEQAKQSGQYAGTEQREYAMSIPKFNLRGIVGSIKSGWGSFKQGAHNFVKNPIKTTAGGVSSFTGTGGSKGYDSFVNEMKSGNKNPLTKEAADWLGRHKTLGLVGSAGLGVGLWNTWGLGENSVKKTAKFLDKNAYAYDESKNQMVQ